MWIVKILSSLPIGSFWSRALLLALLSIGAGYALILHGESRERAKWELKVSQVEAQVKKQTEEANERTRQLIQTYEQRIKNARSTNGSTRPELTTVRVHNSCTSSEDTPVQAGPAPSVPVPVVDQTEWERINHARFEEQRIQLEALITWVDTLYRTWSSR